jgi:hypothetical protein
MDFFLLLLVKLTFKIEIKKKILGGFWKWKLNAIAHFDKYDSKSG